MLARCCWRRKTALAENPVLNDQRRTYREGTQLAQQFPIRQLPPRPIAPAPPPTHCKMRKKIGAIEVTKRIQGKASLLPLSRRNRFPKTSRVSSEAKRRGRGENVVESVKNLATRFVRSAPTFPIRLNVRSALHEPSNDSRATQ